MSTSNQQTLQRYARPVLISTSKSDQNVPFSYQEWVSVYRGIIPGQEFNQYNEYLVNWYKDQNNKNVDSKLQLKINYLTLLRQLQLFFTQEETENWYNQVNIENEKELLLAIPYFARKLRDISLYYLQLRETIKQSRLQYNQVGTESGLAREIQKYILLNYTQKPTNSITLPASLWNNAPELSAVKNSINIQIEELYDTNTYFDRSPTQTLSSYFDINSPELLYFLQQKGLGASSIDWIYSLGVYDLSANIQENAEFDYPLFTELSKQAAEKYLGTEKFLMSQPILSTDTFDYEVLISEGNNFFYWPTGVYASLAKNSPKLQSTPLSSTNIENVATAGKTLSGADTIFVKSVRGIKGAWLRFEDTVGVSETMLAVLDGQSKTDFRFPFPGYGLSAEDTGWTSYSLRSDPRFFFLDQNTQQLVLNEYWTNSLELTSNVPIKLNNTALITNKAYANKDYNLADKITIWSNPPEYTSVVFSNEAKEAWLYQFTKTDISIKPGSESVIVWPYETIDSNNGFPAYYPDNTTDICTPLPLSSIDFTYANPGLNLSSADVIYKIKNYQDSIQDATECYWLSGINLIGFSRDVSKAKQNTLQGIFSSGEYTRFVWEGRDNFNVNTAFKTLQHQPDCSYINTPNVDYRDFNLCECKQVNFTPFGHPGTLYTDNNSTCDFILEDTVTPENLDLTTWKDSSGMSFLSSQQFFWYNTNSKIGWGDGRWVAGGSTRSRRTLLKQGKTYIYYRAKLQDAVTSASKLPSLIVRHNYNTYFSDYGSKHIWVRGTKNENGDWSSTNVPSQSIIYPGDILLYKRASTYPLNYNGITVVERNTVENRGSIWSNYDYVTVGNNNQVVITYPTNTYSGLALSGQPITTSTVEISTRFVGKQAYTLTQFIQLSSLTVTTSISAATLTNIQSVDPTPKSYGIYYNSNNTVTFSFQVTGIREFYDSTKTITTSTINVPNQLSAITLSRIQSVDPTPTTYGTYFEDNDTVTFVFDVTTTRNNFNLLDQNPMYGFNNIVSVLDWEITAPDGTVQTFFNTPAVVFSPVLEGQYTTKVRVITSATLPPSISPLPSIVNNRYTFTYANTGLYTFEGIPPITAVSPFVNVPTLTSYDVKLPGYTLNTSLYGWDYKRAINRAIVDNKNAGAKPYWAKTYLDKDSNTKFKGINKWGTPRRILDGYNIITQPEISDIVLTAGSKISYERKYPTKLEWKQPVDLIITSDKKQWCDLEFTTNTDSNLAYQLNNFKTELVVTPKTTPSTIALENFIDNEPVEIYYNAINAFTWNISALAEIPTVVSPGFSAFSALTPNTPWSNFSNLNYPTVAVLPTFDNFYTISKIGGFFTPNNLGASTYLEQDNLLTFNNYISSLFSKTDLLRGFSKQDQNTPYTATTNNTWQKEPIVSGPIAGTNKKSIFKKYQKFIPYQSNFETNNRNQIGLLTPNSKQSPWTGNENSEWGDSANRPQSFTGELNVDKWATSQVLKKTGLQVYSWTTDIFGNQYGLYKDIKNVPLIEQKDIYGEIWVRDNSQFVSPASKSLQGVFDTYAKTSLINELTGFGVKKIDVFFDTLMIETSGTVIFERIDYDFVTKKIFSLTDEARYLSLALPVTASLAKEFANQNLQQHIFAKCGDTWFLPEEKVIYITVCGLQNFTLTPELYSLDINNQNFIKVFPTSNDDITLINNLSSLNLLTINSPVLSYNPLIKEFVMTVSGKNNNNENNIIVFTINNLPQATILKDVSIYKPLDRSIVQDLPIVQTNLNIQLTKPDFFGLLYSTTNTEKSAVSNGAKLVFYDNTTKNSTLVVAPCINNQTTYPFVSFNTLTGINDFVFKQPVLFNYSVYDLNPTYIQQYGDEELFFVEPLNFVCAPIANGPNTFEAVDLPSWINLTPDGVFTGSAPNTSNSFFGSFKISNAVGSTFYTLNIDIV